MTLMQNNSENRWVCTIKMTPPALKDNTADAERLIGALKTTLNAETIDIDLQLLKRLSFLLREYDFHIKCIFFKERNRWVLIDIKPVLYDKVIAGLAVDLGTTRVVFRVINLENGDVLGESSFDNPQIAIGPDILTRIHFAKDQDGLNKINNLIIQGFNDNIDALCKKTGLTSTDIFIMSVAGNTTMTHLFLGIDPYWIIREPYIPAINRPGLLKALELRVAINENASVYVFPNIGSYFGGDLIAGIIYSGINQKEETSILVDVGTNAEVVLGNKDWLIACAGAAGPALEGGVSNIGMMAGPGVIDRVTVDENNNFDIHTIEDSEPVGICGSGFIDLAAALFKSGAIDIRGKIVPEACGRRFCEIDEMKHFIIVPKDETKASEDISISQASIDSLIRSKAAMYTILETIALNVGMSLSDLSTFYVAGTFGSFINPESAITIGMIPDLPLGKYETLGNSSLGGAALLLESRKYVDEVDKIRDSITYIELNVDQGFMNRFSGAKFLPHTNLNLFPSVKV